MLTDLIQWDRRARKKAKSLKCREEKAKVTTEHTLTAPVGMGGNTGHPDSGVLRMCVGV